MPDIMGAIRGELEGGYGLDEFVPLLSLPPQEERIAGLHLSGATAKVIARKRGIKRRTVYEYFARIKRHTGVTDLADLPSAVFDAAVVGLGLLFDRRAHSGVPSDLPKLLDELLHPDRELVRSVAAARGRHRAQVCLADFVPALPRREAQIARARIRGKPRKTIATSFCISIRMVNEYAERTGRRLGGAGFSTLARAVFTSFLVRLQRTLLRIRRPVDFRGVLSDLCHERPPDDGTREART